MAFSSKSQNYYTNLSIYLNVRNSFLDLKLFIIFCISFFSKEVHAQLGFCQGNSGDPIFTETFGTGLQDSSLPAETTTYAYANGQDPNDGLYTVSSNSDYFDWFDVNDHTPNDTNGRMLIINSSFSAGEFYRTTINGLCENTTYEFSSWLLNLSPLGGFCGSGVIPINVRFEIWDNTDTNLLASGDTGNITSTTSPQWNQFALVFQSLPSQTSVLLKMKNNGAGGCGNDVAIDDIVFKTCGDFVSVSDGVGNASISICSSQIPYTTSLTVTPDFSVFSSHFYQWQESTDGISWIDIVGETNQNISLAGITTTTFYRSKVAESMINLNNSSCNTISDMFQVNIVSVPVMPTIECWETATFDDASCSWSVTGSQPSTPTGLECWETATFNNTTCSWDIAGTQTVQPVIECWETVTFNTTTCSWDILGAQPEEPTGLECWQTTIFNDITCSWSVTGAEPAQPTDLLCWQTTMFNEAICEWEIIGTQPLEFRDEFLFICEDETLTLEAISSIANPSYDWVSGEITSSITIDNAGIYEVEVTDGCFTEIIAFNVTLIEAPVIESIITNGSSIQVNIFNAGNYQYSIDGVNYQFSNVFNNVVPTGLYTIYVKPNDCDVVVTQEHFHFYIQKFITPNGDGENDFFTLNIAQYFASSEVYIFDRYGKLLFSAKNTNVFWDGTVNGNQLPTSDYWYRIVLDGKEIKGHFTLKH